MPLFGPPNIEKLKEKGDVGGLIKALGHKDPSVARHAIGALTELGLAEAAEELSAALDTERREEVRISLVYALGKLGNPKAVGSLTKALDDHSARVRGGAASALGKIGDHRVAQSLAPLLRDKIFEVRREAGRSLQILGATEILISALGDSDPEVRGGAAWALWLNPEVPSEAAAPLIARLEDEDPSTRANAAQALAKVDPPPTDALKPLIRLMNDPDKHVRTAASEGLGAHADPAAVDALLRALEDADVDVRSSACSALGRIKDPRAVKALIGKLSEDWRTSDAAVGALHEIGEPAVPALIEELRRSDDADVVKQVSRLLGQFPEHRAQVEVAIGYGPQELAVEILAGRMREVPEAAFGTGLIDRVSSEQLREGLLADEAVARVALGVAVRLRRFDLFKEVVQACRTTKLEPQEDVLAGYERVLAANYFEDYVRQGEKEARQVLALLRYGPGLRDAAAFAIGYLRAHAPEGSLQRLRSALAQERDQTVAYTLAKAISRVEAGDG